MTDEEFYDAEVAPVLMDLARKCETRGQGFVAMVQFNGPACGTTATLPVGAPASLRWLYSLAKARDDDGSVNIDGFLFAVMNEAERTGHSSVMLARLGVPHSPT